MRRTTLFRVPILLLTTGVLFGAVGCGGTNRARSSKKKFRRSFGMVFERYQTFDEEKALAVARDEAGRWAYGFARGQESEIAAVNAAEKQCKSNRARYGVRAACRTYAVGREITGDPAWVAPPKE